MKTEDADKMARLIAADDIGVPESWNTLSYQIIGAAMEVHSALGPALPEKLYEEALEYELRRRGLRVDRQRQIRLKYKDLILPPVIPDMVVNDLIIVELKAIERVRDEDLGRLTSYLVAADLPLALLLNFHALRLKDGLFRRINSRCSLMQPRPSAIHASAGAIPGNPKQLVTNHPPRDSEPSATSAS